MIITRKSQVLLNFLDLRVVINEKDIYPLFKEQPVVVNLASQRVTLVVSDGFHITPRLQITCQPRNVCHLHIVCSIDDNLFFTGVLFTVLLVLVGIISDFLPGKLLSFFPVFYLLYFFYIRKQDFLRVKIIPPP